MADRSHRRPGPPSRGTALDERYKRLVEAYREAQMVNWHERAWAETYGQVELDATGGPRRQAINKKWGRRR